MQSFQNSDDVSLEDLPGTFWLLVVGVALVVFGFALEWLGYPTEAGISGALALFFIGIAVLGQLLIWVLGKIE